MNIGPRRILSIKNDSFLSITKKSDKICNRSPEILFCFNLKISPSCQTLSKALDISKKTPLTSNPSSNDFQISWVIDKNWLIHESAGLTFDWFGEIGLLEVKNLKISLKISLSKILPQMGRRETGR